MKSVFLSVVSFLTVFSSVNAASWVSSRETPSSINYFEGSFEDALKLSAETGKPILLEAHASWCGVCKKMASTTMLDGLVVETINASYIALNMDMEKGEGPELKQRYGISGYPTILVINVEGAIEKTIPGYVGAGDLVKELSIEKKSAPSGGCPLGGH
ncbi:MAG: thioredoxin family protein [Flavobacteriales bacterium]|jgi:thiol:disulfide interchange protein|nr:thioredoxin family protein [Flavobacteriales bacterium]